MLAVFTHASLPPSPHAQNGLTTQKDNTHGAALVHSFVRSGADHALPGRVQPLAGARHSRERSSATAQVLDIIPLPVQLVTTQHKHFRLGIVH